MFDQAEPQHTPARNTFMQLVVIVWLAWRDMCSRESISAMHSTARLGTQRDTIAKNASRLRNTASEMINTVAVLAEFSVTWMGKFVPRCLLTVVEKRYVFDSVSRTQSGSRCIKLQESGETSLEQPGGNVNAKLGVSLACA